MFVDFGVTYQSNTYLYGADNSLTDQELQLADCLVRIFENVILTEEKSIQKGYFDNLSLAEMHTLDAIGAYESRTMTETAERLGITVGTLSVAVDRLVKKGYVIRKRDENDRRIMRVSLTRNGKIASRIHGKYHYVLSRRILEPYSDEEKALLLEMVKDIDKYMVKQVERYDDDIKSIRRTAKVVSKDKRKRESEDG